MERISTPEMRRRRSRISIPVVPASPSIEDLACRHG
jgi:hypothetical protein